MPSSLFSHVEFDPDTYARVMRRPAAQTRYVIYFTPRSGSSWLTDILGQSGRLSKANEAFNPNFIPNIAQVCNAATLEQYVNVLLRRHNTGGVYGCEVTLHQLNAVFGDPAEFLRLLDPGPCFWLLREDIVAQAVSLAKMVATKVTHAPHASEEARRDSDRQFSYSARQIRRWLVHILNAERDSEALFARHGLHPLRMSYEQITRRSAAEMVALVARHVGVAGLEPGEVQSQHTKIATERNAEFAQRFRAEEADFLAEVAAERAPWLARLDDLDSLIRPA